MLKKTMLSRSLLLAFSSTAALAGGAAHAQQSGVQELQRVEVTGSNIRRTDSETASPVQTLTREDIQKSGKTSVAELLQTLAVDNQGSVPTTFGNGFASGASGISLRGLGAASTLVLINGRRIAPYGLADDGQKVFTDLNMVPLEAVDRVDIVKDGGSAIYGSDAIAGVVNIILRSDFQGAVGKISYGESRYGDGAETRAAVTAGFGDLTSDKYNFLFNLEAGKKDPIWNRDRAGRGQVGRADLRDLGYSAEQALGGTGAITSGGAAAGNSIIGNVRNPTSLLYYSRDNQNTAATGFLRTYPGAACGNFSGHIQGDPGGGCLIDGPQAYSQVQPSQESLNLFSRATLNLGGSLQGYGEVNLYKNKSEASTTPSSVSSSVGYPGGPVSNSGVALGAAHPDNPYVGSVARFRYLAADVGPRVSDVDSFFSRVVLGLKGTLAEWDFNTAALTSQNRVSNERHGYLQRDVTFALLNPSSAANVASATANSAAYRALPAGTYWRIGENANLNSPAVYAALSPTISNNAVSKTSQIDFKANREFGQLAGGPIGVAVGTEFRRESVRLDPTTGTDRGNIIGLGYSAYDGARNVFAAFGEVNAPVLKSLELSAAIRADRYSGGIETSVTPKLGAKWTPVKEFAVRGTYAEAFRAPSPAENGVGGLAAFSTAKDPVRCALGVTTACSAANVAIITSPNADLEPEKSKSYTLGFVWSPAPKTNVTVDFWQIVRRNEINQEQTAAAIAAGHVARDPSTAQPGIAGDPGAITAVLAKYENSARSTVRGVDLDLNQGVELGENGKLTFDAKWTHLFKWLRKEQDGSEFDYAGTHGNCDVTNCIGTPADRINLSVGWERGPLKVGANLNYRASIKNVAFKDDPDGCLTVFADGSDAPKGCKIGSFYTVDLTMRWQATQKLEIFGSVNNLFDRVPPVDPTTYGAVSYNPLDYSGAIGRYYNVGLRYKF